MRDVEAGRTTQGESRTTALKNLNDAVALHDGERGLAPTDDELRTGTLRDIAENAGANDSDVFRDWIDRNAREGL